MGTGTGRVHVSTTGPRENFWLNAAKEEEEAAGHHIPAVYPVEPPHMTVEAPNISESSQSALASSKVPVAGPKDSCWIKAAKLEGATVQE